MDKIKFSDLSLPLKIVIVCGWIFTVTVALMMIGQMLSFILG
jgi:hypothetical protein